jgi:hypothetical protein
MNVYERHGLMNVEFESICIDYALLYYLMFISYVSAGNRQAFCIIGRKYKYC